MGRCALEESQRLEAQLANEEEQLQRTLASVAADTGTGRSLLEEFRAARQAWLEYKDAECSYAYATALGGELRGRNAAVCLRDLFRARLERVRAERERLEGAQTADEARAPAQPRKSAQPTGMR